MRCDFKHIRLELYKSVCAMCFGGSCWDGCVFVIIILGIFFTADRMGSF